ncbi:MAG: TIGR00730 family Rossman fold protein [Pseudomonadota bacterium]
MSVIESVCVYCGASPGQNPAYVAAATELGSALAAAGIRLVYGGGSLGLMGTVARAALRGGGQVTGIIPRFLVRQEVMLEGVDDLIVTTSMHERKQLMFERSDAFVALPGGIGTLEELVEMLTWLQLGQHEKPVALANVEGFWDPLQALIGHMDHEGFLHRNVPLQLVEDVPEILPRLATMAAEIGNQAASADAPAFSNL